ncbi:dehydrodolichyl diphosphate synthase complex subunit nus1 [Nephila pilipes]|uniref:ditrans,polycis-polyprenyl diphosphate synthase [(2E,6E)-farnesyldiphosphate specific] n=2 Tax=Nephila pilipes TaxID=299642 RepID=A0A8X6ULH5_NEPPI|nr:dehydrodolichyl diphosphate synthase complex subunit nus1 [Nephila pilipes]
MVLAQFSLMPVRSTKDLCLFIQHCMSLLPGFLQVKDPVKQAWFKKLPSHLGIIICEDRISFNDISNLIIWSFCVGIHHVSIYDSTGFIKSNGNQLYREANLRKDSYLQKKANSLNIIFSDGKVPYLYNTFIKNGHKTEDVNVYLLSHEDGKQQIVKAAKMLCKDARWKPEILEDFYAHQFEHYIKGTLDVPDPELLVLFGKTSALIGYLPWHIRLSEIMFQTTHHNFSFDEFQSLLCHYNKCEQRFGK